MTPNALRTAALLALCFLAPPPAPAQVGNLAGKVRLRNFLIAGHDDAGQTWQIRGSDTQSAGQHIAISDFTLDYALKRTRTRAQNLLGDDPNPVTPVRIASAECVLNTLTREVKSDEAIHMTFGQNLRLSGIGYDIDVPGKVILIRSAVSLSFRHPTGKHPLTPLREHRTAP